MPRLIATFGLAAGLFGAAHALAWPFSFEIRNERITSIRISDSANKPAH